MRPLKRQYQHLSNNNFELYQSNKMNFLRPLRSLRCVIRKMGEWAENRDQYWIDRIGTREIVGYGKF